MRLTYSEQEDAVIAFLDAFSEGQLVLYNCRLSISKAVATSLRSRCIHQPPVETPELQIDFAVAVTSDDGEAHPIDIENPVMRYSDGGVAFGFAHAGVNYGTYTVPWLALGRAAEGESVAFEQAVYYG